MHTKERSEPSGNLWLTVPLLFVGLITLIDIGGALVLLVIGKK